MLDTSVTFLGAHPCTHMGHVIDIGESMMEIEGRKVIGLSSSSKELNSYTRIEKIAAKQFGPEFEIYIVKNLGDLLKLVWTPCTILHLHFGWDRKDFVDRIIKSLNEDKFIELNGNRFFYHIKHFPNDDNRSHGFSGTNMRRAIIEGNLDLFHRHIGTETMNREEAEVLMNSLNGIKENRK